MTKEIEIEENEGLLMISIWVFVVCLAIPVLLGYDIALIFTEWVNSKYDIMVKRRQEEEEAQECQ